MLIIEGLGSGKTNPLFDLINHQPVIDKICLYAKDPYEAKYQFVITKCENVGTNHFTFIEYSNNIDYIIKTVKITTQIKNVNN